MYAAVAANRAERPRQNAWRNQAWQRTTREMKLTNVFFYPKFVRDTLRRVRDGRPPVANLADNAAAVALIEAAYALSPLAA